MAFLLLPANLLWEDGIFFVCFKMNLFARNQESKTGVDPTFLEKLESYCQAFCCTSAKMPPTYHPAYLPLTRLDLPFLRRSFHSEEIKLIKPESIRLSVTDCPTRGMACSSTKVGSAVPCHLLCTAAQQKRRIMQALHNARSLFGRNRQPLFHGRMHQSNKQNNSTKPLSQNK